MNDTIVGEASPPEEAHVLGDGSDVIDAHRRAGKSDVMVELSLLRGLRCG